MADWIEWGRRRRRWADTTCDGYRRRVTSWLNWCTTHGVRPTRASPAHVSQWLDTLHPSPGVHTAGHTALLAWFDWQVEKGATKRNPVRDVPRVPVGKSLPRSLDSHAVSAVLTAAAKQGPRSHLFIGLMAYAGLRRAEAAGLRWIDVEGTDAWLRVDGKGGVQRIVPIHPSLRPMLVYWRTVGRHPEWIFPGRYGGPISTATATNWTRAVLDAAGLPHVTGHALRHSFGRRLVEVGVPLPDVMASLGHQSLSSTTIYVRARPHQVAEAVSRLDYR